MEERAEYKAGEPSALPPMAAGIKAEITGLAGEMTAKNYREQLREMSRVLWHWFQSVDSRTEEGDGNDAE